MTLLRILLCTLALMVAYLSGSALAQDAQTSPAASTETAAETTGDVAETAAPDTVTAADITQMRPRIDTLPEAERADMRARLDAVDARLRSLAETRAQERRFREAADTGDTRPDALRADIERIRRQPPVGNVDADRMDNSRLRQLEDELQQAEARLAGLRTQVADANAELQGFAQRTGALPGESEQARERLANVERQLAELPETPASVAGEVRALELNSRRTFQQARISALEAERASIPTRRETLRLSVDRDTLLIQRLTRRVESLQSLTGQRLMNEASALARRNRAAVAGASSLSGDIHPLVEDFAASNAELVERLGNIAEADVALPRQTAGAQAQLDAVTNNLVIVTQLTELGDLDRRAGETLRRLRSTVPVLPAIEADIESTRAAIIEAGQDYLLAEEELRLLPFGRTDLSPLLEAYRRTNPDVRDLNMAEAAWLAELYDLRRATLDRISAAATSRREDAATLQTTQRQLLEKATELKTTLDENLLWLPSAEPVSTAWPGKIVRGTVELLSPSRVGAILEAGVEQVRRIRFWPPLLIVIVFVLGVFARRAALRASIAERGKVVGKVREDSYFATPIVAAEGMLIAAPLPLMLAFAGWVLTSAESVLPIVISAGTALLATSLFLFETMTLRVWSEEGGLFQRHLPLPDRLRRGIQIETRWFIPVAGSAIFIAELTHEARNVDLYEGVSVLAFLVLCASISLVFYRLLLGGRDPLMRNLDPDGSMHRWRNILIGLTIGVPALAGLFAAFGYFATSEEVVARLLRTMGLATISFVVYGILKRSVNITHRRLSLKQLMEKREAALEERRRVAAAEAEAAGDEAGEASLPSPPPVDYEQIDLESSSRQTRKLILTVMLIGFTFVLWMIWRDLLPALGALDDIQLYENGTRTIGEGEDATEVTQFITLWDVVRAGVTIVLTLLAARNLPGFLEVFVLNRSSMDQGVKYAVITIMGYVIVAFGIVTALNQLGVRWGQLGFIVAALGVGIGFGLQEIIANFISGIIILFERPVRVGDYVTVGDQSGTVSRIKIRATTLTDLDNKEILIPNKEFITSRVTNWTLSNSILRIIIPVGIAYGSDTKNAQKIMLDVLQNEPRVLEKPAPQAIFVNFGDSSLDFELRVFIRSFEDRFPMINAVHTNINLALEEAGIGIPFPQRDLHLVTADAKLQLGQALAQGSGKGGMPAVGPDPSLAAE